MDTKQMTKTLKTIKDEGLYREALIEAGAEESSAAMCAIEARVEGFTGHMAASHAAYCLNDRSALTRDAGHAERQLRKVGRPVTGLPRRQVLHTTVAAETLAAIEAGRKDGESQGQVLDRWAAMARESGQKGEKS